RSPPREVRAAAKIRASSPVASTSSTQAIRGIHGSPVPLRPRVTKGLSSPPGRVAAESIRARVAPIVADALGRWARTARGDARPVDMTERRGGLRDGADRRGRAAGAGAPADD